MYRDNMNNFNALMLFLLNRWVL